MSGIVDIFWGLEFAGVVDIAAWLGQSGGARTSAVLFLVNLWGLTAGRPYLGPGIRGEDHRYAAMRQKFGKKWWWLSLIQVFLLQAILIWFVPAPQVARRCSTPACPWATPGQICRDRRGGSGADVPDPWRTSRLAAFRADPGSQGKVMDRGLWGWSRHPNYFGEALMWWGYFAIGFGASHQWWLVLSPVLITFLLLQVSGVTLMEEKMDDTVRAMHRTIAGSARSCPGRRKNSELSWPANAGPAGNARAILSGESPSKLDGHTSRWAMTNYDLTGKWTIS